MSKVFLHITAKDMLVINVITPMSNILQAKQTYLVVIL